MTSQQLDGWTPAEWKRSFWTLSPNFCQCFSSSVLSMKPELTFTSCWFLSVTQGLREVKVEPGVVLLGSAVSCPFTKKPPNCLTAQTGMRCTAISQTATLHFTVLEPSPAPPWRITLLACFSRPLSERWLSLAFPSRFLSKIRALGRRKSSNLNVSSQERNKWATEMHNCVSMDPSHVFAWRQ